MVDDEHFRLTSDLNILHVVVEICFYEGQPCMVEINHFLLTILLKYIVCDYVESRE